MTNLKKLPLAFKWLLFGLVFYALIIMSYINYMGSKPIEEKLGYMPSTRLIRPLSADQKELVGASLVMKVIMYFGGLVESQQSNAVPVPPDYQGMSRMLHGALELDPYNLDAYYFAQSFLTWDVKQYKIANDLLDYGMKYRTWDWMLPYFAGFNSAYFLKDYKHAAEYYKRAGELSGGELNISLAGRYMQESGQTDLAIAYLNTMIKGERNQAVKKRYQIRIVAFNEVRRIERARDSYLKSGGHLPTTVEFLIYSGLLAPPPSDPYGGRFYLDPDGKVETTSKFAFAGTSKDSSQKAGK